MISDLIEDMKDDYGVSLYLEMRNNGHVFLSIDEYHFHLSPTPQGHQQAQVIEDALLAWREQTKVNITREIETTLTTKEKQHEDTD